MSRLRIRVELNRGGVGIPLHKLSSVVKEAEKFFEMLGEDVRIQKDRGEWLAFDFDNESLNFTAEYVGPASAEQVQAFAAAFDGTTSLRRATIAQFTHITDAIGEDEMIGFGLYHSDHEAEPSEWRCLSRRDALRIADEIQVLLGASGEQDQATHLPAVIDTGMGARMFKERHERGALTGDQAKLPGMVREIEENLSKRLSRLESQVEDHSRSIHELHDTSGATEESFRNLLSSVETFCAQATRQLEKITPAVSAPAIAAPAPIVAAPEPAIAAPAPVAAVPVTAAPVITPVSPTIAVPTILPAAPVIATVEAAPIKPSPFKANPSAPVSPVTIRVSPTRSWRAYGIAAILIIGIVSLAVFVWSPRPGEPAENKVAAASVPALTETQPESAPAVPATVEPKVKMSKGEPMHVEIEAREPAWVTVTDASGKRLIAKTFEANETYSLELTAGATLRTGNAGGLVVKFNGKEIGPLGPTGKIRDISFKEGGYKVHAPDAG
jgi:hypothetical protein